MYFHSEKLYIIYNFQSQSQNYCYGKIPLSSTTVASSAVSDIFQILTIFFCLFPFHITFWPEGNSRILQFHCFPIPSPLPPHPFSVMTFSLAQSCNISILSSWLCSLSFSDLYASRGSFLSTFKQITGSITPEQLYCRYLSTAAYLLLWDMQIIQPASSLPVLHNPWPSRNKWKMPLV